MLQDVSWQSYEAIGAALRDRSGLHLTYDRGVLEIVTLSPEHEKLKHRLSRFLEVLAEELGLALEPGGSMTFKREGLERGLEPDECFWIANEARVRGKLEWDPEVDPPPDLVLEIEVSRSAVDRMDIYAALGVSEVWRFNRERLQVWQLQADGRYQTVDASPTFPAIPTSGIAGFLAADEKTDYLSAVRAFRAWVRDHALGK